MQTRRLHGLALVVAAVTASVAATDLAAAATAPRWVPDRRSVPILMYHVIADPPASAPFPDLYVS